MSHKIARDAIAAAAAILAMPDAENRIVELCRKYESLLEGTELVCSGEDLNLYIDAMKISTERLAFAALARNIDAGPVVKFLTAWLNSRWIDKKLKFDAIAVCWAIKLTPAAPTSTPFKPLTETAIKIAAYIDKYPGKTGQEIANGLGDFTSHDTVRKIFSVQLAPRGYTNVKGRGYFSPGFVNQCDPV